MRMGKDQNIQHGPTTNRTAMDWFQRIPRHRARRELPGRPPPIHTTRPSKPPFPPDHQQSAASCPRSSARSEPDDWQTVDAAQPHSLLSRPSSAGQPVVVVHANCLVPDPKTVIEASEGLPARGDGQAGMNVIPQSTCVSPQARRRPSSGIHPLADVYREGESAHPLSRTAVADPTPGRPEMWND